MNKKYQIKIYEKLIGYTSLEKADAPMGVVFGEITFIEQEFGYNSIKKYCMDNKISLAYDYPEDKMISTMTISELKVMNDKGVEIKGIGNQISGKDNDEYEISIFGIPYPFYEKEFPHHVEQYEN